VSDDTERQQRHAQAHADRWTADAKKLLESGKEAAALELYRRAADELPGAPWLQHRTAELARKLKQTEIAIAYFRRAGTAFQLAGFAKRAQAPLRTGWTLACEGLPGTARVLVEVAVELMQLHRQLGFSADATVLFERTNAVLRSRGFSELPPHTLDSVAPRSSQHPVRSTPVPAPVRASTPAASDAAPSSRSRALARLFGRR
jgi:hypothetical protein